jgi:hypothetical protein
MPGFRSRTLLVSSAVAIILLGGMMMPSYAKDGRLYITFIKSGAIINGTGSMFYEGRRYRISVDGIDASKFGSSRVYLDGTASNLQDPSDVLGAYVAVEGDSAVARDTQPTRLKNTEGALVELHGIKNEKFLLDLNGLTVHDRGWHSK